MNVFLACFLSFLALTSFYPLILGVKVIVAFDHIQTHLTS